MDADIVAIFESDSVCVIFFYFFKQVFPSQYLVLLFKSVIFILLRVIDNNDSNKYSRGMCFYSCMFARIVSFSLHFRVF